MVKRSVKNKPLILRLFDFFSSIRLAIIVILGLAVISAVGTITEARYDSPYALKLVYHSIYMYLILGLLVVNLTCVMIDRWPWKRHHVAFISAHIGIIVLLIGSVVTRYWGVDGSMTFGINESERYVTVPETEVVLFSMFETRYENLGRYARDFLLSPPQKNPLEIQLGTSKVRVVDYAHYADRQIFFKPSDKEWDGPGIRLQIESSRVNSTQWLVKPAAIPTERLNLGPATFVLTSVKDYIPTQGNEMAFRAIDNETLQYQILAEKNKKFFKTGTMKVGDVVETGWMDIRVRLINFYPRARQEIQIKPRERPHPLAISAIKVEYKGQEHWVGLNSFVRLFDNERAYVLSFANRRLDLGFSIHLDKFSVGRYQGTNRAMTYESDVTVEGLGKVNISMNEPMKHAGYTFYQSSFQEDDMGKPTASILSVNKDPGRWIKYLGSALIVLGIVMLFYFRKFDLKFMPKKSEKALAEK